MSILIRPVNITPWTVTRQSTRRAYSRSLGQRSIFGRRGHFFMKKEPKKFHFPPYSIPFQSALHQNKSLHNFQKRWQHSVVEHNIGLEYVLTR